MAMTSAKMTPIVKEWYDYLAEGKIMGLRCKDCGYIEFPPTPVCKKCSSTDLEWDEVAPGGDLLSLSFSPVGIPGYTQDPALTGYARMDEGMLFATVIDGVGVDDQDALIERMRHETVRVEMVVVPIDDTHYFPHFVIK